MMNEKNDEKAFMSPEELITLLWTFCGEDKPLKRPALSVEELRGILSRTVGAGQPNPENVDAAISEALRRYEANNPEGGGLTFRDIHSFLTRGGDNVPFELVETRINDLLESDKIHYDRSGMVTVYRSGKHPDKIKEEETGENKTPPQ